MIQKNSSSLLKVTIKNNHSFDIRVVNVATYSWYGDRFMGGPTSYMQLIGNPFTNGDGVNTPNKQRPRTIDGGVVTTINHISEPLLFTGTIDGGGFPAMKSFEIPAGGSYEDELFIFGDLPSPFIAFPLEDKINITKVYLKLVLSYFDLVNKKGYHRAEFISNEISL